MEIKDEKKTQDRDNTEILADGTEGEKFQAADVFTISLAHGVHDTYTAFVAPLLPVLIKNLSLTKTLAGALTIFTQLPSIFQPIIGHLADSINLRIFVILAPAVSGILVSLIGIAPTYVYIALLLFIAGFSSALLHSIGPVMTGYHSGKRLGRGMSYWMVGGEVGRTLGPIIIVTAIGYLTMERIPWLAIGGVITSIILFIRFKDIPDLTPKTRNGLSIWTAIGGMKSLMIPLSAIIIVRTFMSSALTTYLPTFLTDEGSSLWLAGASLSVLEAAGVLGALLAGSISDRIGRRVVIFISLSVSPILMLIFLAVKDWMQIPVLLLLGFFSISLTPVIMALVQESFPENRALANGVYMALSFILRSLLVILIGTIGDHYGLRLAFYISIVLMLCGLPIIPFLPKRSKHHLNT
ncbi:MAG: MFS transporter [Anaerolineaceae bacterium]|nr:MFS transporter [Anaerolineaceae bacterium]